MPVQRPKLPITVSRVSISWSSGCGGSTMAVCDRSAYRVKGKPDPAKAARSGISMKWGSAEKSSVDSASTEARVDSARQAQSPAWGFTPSGRRTSRVLVCRGWNSGSFTRTVSEASSALPSHRPRPPRDSREGALARRHERTKLSLSDRLMSALSVDDGTELR